MKTHALSFAFDPSQILSVQGLTPDSWQREVLECRDRQILLNCSRQAGKSTVTAAKALHVALFTPRSLILLLSPTLRQSHELFRKILDAYNALGRPLRPVQDAASGSKIEFHNGSRIVGLPGRESNIRSFSSVSLLIIDEAARVPDDLYRSVRPMLAVSRGQLLLLSTPFGQRGFFWKEWHSANPWRRFRVTWQDCPRVTADFIDNEVRSMGQPWVDQEYLCCFTALEGLVYPEFEQCLIDWELPMRERNPVAWVGGIDWGYNNPFAALWGYRDHDDVLWIGWERYRRQCVVHDHIDAITAVRSTDPRCPDPKWITWYADPSGPAEITNCRAAGWKVLRGNNDIRLGIAAVTARIRTGRLKVVRPSCPNLIAESQLYRYPTAAERAVPGETPIDEHNHALGALRYLISRLDHRFIAKLRQPGASTLADDEAPPPEPVRNPSRRDCEDLWTVL